MAGKQGFVPPSFSNLFNIKYLRDKCLKTHNFILSFSFVYFDIFSYFLPLDGHKMDTSLSKRLLVINARNIRSLVGMPQSELGSSSRHSLCLHILIMHC